MFPAGSMVLSVSAVGRRAHRMTDLGDIDGSMSKVHCSTLLATTFVSQCSSGEAPTSTMLRLEMHRRIALLMTSAVSLGKAEWSVNTQQDLMHFNR